MPESVYESILALGAKRLLELRLVREIRMANPTIGSEISLPVPGGVFYELINVRFILNTSAVVANRTPTIRIANQDSQTVAQFSSPSALAASLSAIYNFTIGYGDHTSLGMNSIGLPTPPIVVPSSWSISTLTNNIDSGDQFSTPVFVVRQWSETDLVQETGVIADQISSLYGREVTGR